MKPSKLLVILTAFCAVATLSGCATCIKSHQEPTVYAGYTTYMRVGKVNVPQYHPARKGTKTVCDEYERK